MRWLRCQFIIYTLQSRLYSGQKNCLLSTSASRQEEVLEMGMIINNKVALGSVCVPTQMFLIKGSF